MSQIHHGGKRKINDDVRPFTKAGSLFADSRFFEEDFAPKEMIISTISSTSKGDSKTIKDTLATMGYNGAK